MTTALLQIADRSRHDAWHRSLVQTSDRSAAGSKSVAETQRALLAAADAGTVPLAEYLFAQLDVAASDADDAVPQLPRLTSTAMQKLPLHDEQQIAVALQRHLTPAEAASPAAWTLCHAVWISRGCFGVDPAAALCQAPAATTPDDTRVRRFLRHTGGLHIVRGAVSVLVDCPVAAAYWRRRTAERAAHAAGPPLTPDEAHNALWPNQVWESVARMSVKQVTAIAAPRALAAVITAIAQRNAPPTGSQVQAAIRAVGRLSHGRCLAFAHWGTLHAAAAAGLGAGASQTIRPRAAAAPRATVTSSPSRR